ncbi:MAG: TIGR01777 family protein [Deltaproteobacteria bacterium]|nr:TIGR01777 family protein [Deltaproteobacteria bacterium]
MRIFMTGGTGFVGRNLSRVLMARGHEVTILTRGRGAVPAGVSVLTGDPTEKGVWQRSVRDHEIVINLAGATIFHRWTTSYKRLVRESRLRTTRNLVGALDGAAGRIFFSTSAVGYYGFHGDEVLTEASPPGTDFLAVLARDWEEEARRAEGRGARVLITRFGIVLGRGGGALDQMIPLFKWGLGGPLGSGQQWFSWVHMEDLCRAYLFLIDRPDLSGPFNFTAPHPVPNRELARALGKATRRPSWMRAPGFLMKLLLGEFGSVLLKGQRVVPRRLLDGGFHFNYPDLAEALGEIISPSRERPPELVKKGP